MQSNDYRKIKREIQKKIDVFEKWYDSIGIPETI